MGIYTLRQELFADRHLGDQCRQRYEGSEKSMERDYSVVKEHSLGPVEGMVQPFPQFEIHRSQPGIPYHTRAMAKFRTPRSA